MSGTIAIIDLGTNTFHLLIAELHNNSCRIIHRVKTPVKLGMGGINQNVIRNDAIKRAVETLDAFKSTIEHHQVQKVWAFGTSALRHAQNRDGVIRYIKESSGIDVQVISGDEEAHFIYLGVRSAVQLGTEPSLIMDIGGGSVEFIIGNAEDILWKQSMEMGAQRLLEKYQHHDPIHPNEIQNLENYFKLKLAPLYSAIKEFNPKVFVGSSGTFDTLSDIYCMETGIQKHDDPETPLTIPAFYSIYQKLISKDRKQRMLIPGMIEMRVDMIVVACCLIKHILENHSFNKIRVSSYSLKEGILEHILKS